VRTLRAVLACLLAQACVFGSVASGAADPPSGGSPGPPEMSRDQLLKDLDIRVWGPWRQTAERDWVFDGPVSITWRESRIQADRLSLTEGRFIEA
jgi:hypothetical protein